MQEHHRGQKNLKVFRRRLKEQEELHRSQKNPLVLHMSSKERPARHMSLMRLMGHHTNLKAVNQVKMLELAVLHRSLKKKKQKSVPHWNCWQKMVLYKNCWQKMVLHRNCWEKTVLYRNQSGPEGLHKNLKGLIVQDWFHRSLLPVASCRSWSAGLGRNRNQEMQTGL